MIDTTAKGARQNKNGRGRGGRHAPPPRKKMFYTVIESNLYAQLLLSSENGPIEFSSLRDQNFRNPT